MQLEYICDMELVYCVTPVIETKFVLVRPYKGEEGSAYGEGEGTVSGDKLNGRLRWVNHPHYRSDGAILPNVHGVIITDDGAHILFNLKGRAFGDEGKQLLTVLFEAENEQYSWLNMSLCILEGVIRPEKMSMQGRVYRCVHDFHP